MRLHEWIYRPVGRRIKYTEENERIKMVEQHKLYMTRPYIRVDTF